MSDSTISLDPMAEPMIPRRVLLVDDHPVVRQGVRLLIDRESDLDVCGEAGTLQEALEAIECHQPDIVLVDLSLGSESGLDLMKLMVEQDMGVRILVLSMHDESIYAERALRAGAHGYVMKDCSPDELFAAIREVLDGNIHVSATVASRMISRSLQGNGGSGGSMTVDLLSNRELEVFRLIGGGGSTSQVADALGLSVKTIETYRAHIKRKLGFADGNDLVRQAIRWVDRVMPTPAIAPSSTT
jgi:DNA-binding NarL/FixJ family response regulator